MSYDLMVFDKNSAPKTRVEFMKWYEQQTAWEEEHSYDDPTVSTKELKAWFFDITTTFPALNGLYATEEESERVTGYSVGMKVIYATFAWSMAGVAYKTMLELAERHQVGFFNVSADNGEILIPVNGKLQYLENANKKSWWKFW